MMMRPAVAFTFVSFAFAANNMLLSNVFGDSMVLQRGAARIWGFTPAHTNVTITVVGAGFKEVATANQDNLWVQALDQLSGEGPYEISVSAAAGGTVAISDVLIGDVYFCR